MDVGQKDMKKGVRAILQEIFQLPRMNRKKLIGDIVNMGVNVKTGAGARFHYMLHLVSGNTEYDKTMQGITTFPQFFFFIHPSPFQSH